MKAVKFKEANLEIQGIEGEFNSIPCCAKTSLDQTSAEITICFKLTEEEIKQVNETGLIWFQQYQSPHTNFHPISESFLKPDLGKPLTPEESIIQADVVEKLNKKEDKPN